MRKDTDFVARGSGRRVPSASVSEARLELLVAARLLGPGPHPSALPPPSPLSPLLSPSPARLLRGHLCVPLGPTLLILDDLKILHLLTSAKTLFVKVTFSDFKDLMWT